MSLALVTWLPLLLVGGALLLAVLIWVSIAPLVLELRLRRRASHMLHTRHIGARRSHARAAPARRSSAAPIMRDEDLSGWVMRLEAALPGLRRRLDATGHVIATSHFAAAVVLVALLVAAGALLAGAGLFVAIALAIGSAGVLPWLALRQVAQRRRNRFAAGMPEAIGLIVRGLKAGLPIADTIVEVGREINGPVGAEFAGVGDALRLGQSLEVALWEVARRFRLAALDFFVITLAVQRETGGNLARTLENLDEILRSREAMRLKIKAMSSEAVASAMIIGALPLVMGVLMLVASPGYIDPLFTTGLGHVLLAGAVASMVIGALVMRQMVRFEI
ncbi:MAG: type II secretion system F family protein [Polymorphobacter sp.]